MNKAKKPSYLDTHHLCFQKRRWKARFAVTLRDYWYCRIDIPKNTLHKAIHRRVDSVPVPRPVNAHDALLQLQKLSMYGAISESDPIEKRLEVLISLFDCVEQPTADAFREQLKVVHEFNKKSPQ